MKHPIFEWAEEMHKIRMIEKGFQLLIICAILFIVAHLLYKKKFSKIIQKKREDAAYAALKRLEAEKEKELSEKSRE